MGRARWFLVSGFLAAAVLTVILKPWQRELVPAEQVSRNQLVLQQGRLMKTSQTNAFTGLMVEFYPDGTLQSRSAVSNGLLHGVSEGWHTNGVLAITEVFVSGTSHGTRTKWDAASNRIAETDIREGEIEGLNPVLEFLALRGRSYSVIGSDDLVTWVPASFQIQGASASASVSFYQSSQLKQVRVTVPADSGKAPPKFFKLLVK